MKEEDDPAEGVSIYHFELARHNESAGDPLVVNSANKGLLDLPFGLIITTADSL